MNGALGQILTIILSVGGAGASAWLVARQNRKSAVEVAVAHTEVQEAEADLRRDEFAMSAMERSLRQLAADNAELHKKVDAQDRRIDSLAQSLHAEQQRFQTLLRYTQRLRDWIAQHVPGIDPPQPPRELEGVI